MATKPPGSLRSPPAWKACMASSVTIDCHFLLPQLNLFTRWGRLTIKPGLQSVRWQELHSVSQNTAACDFVVSERHTVCYFWITNVLPGRQIRGPDGATAPRRAFGLPPKKRPEPDLRRQPVGSLTAVKAWRPGPGATFLVDAGPSALKRLRAAHLLLTWQSCLLHHLALSPFADAIQGSLRPRVSRESGASRPNHSRRGRDSAVPSCSNTSHVPGSPISFRGSNTYGPR